MSQHSAEKICLNGSFEYNCEEINSQIKQEIKLQTFIGYDADNAVI